MRAILLSGLCLVGCVKHSAVPSSGLARSSNVHLRDSFDTDASAYVGRFFPRDAVSLDETEAMTLSCSKHIKVKQVQGGGVTYNEVVNVSGEMAARMGIPVVMSAEGSASYSGSVRVQYTLLGKLVAHIPDPEAFTQCCMDHPSQCTDRYVGEVLQGTGSVYQDSVMAGQLTAAGISGALSGGGNAAHQSESSRKIEFPNPVYFAFKISKTQAGRVTASACGDWVDNPPKAEGGRYFVGVSRPLRDEKAARKEAKDVAVLQAYNTMGGNNHTDVQRAVLYNKAGNPLVTWALGMKPVKWCTVAKNKRRNPKLVARMLGYLPDYVPERDRNRDKDAQ